MNPWDGHRYGVEKFEDVINWCVELNVPQVSIWTLSTENVKNRSRKEITEIFKLLKGYMKKWENEKSSVYELFNRYEVKVRFFGDFKKLPPELIRLMNRIMKRTEKHHKKILNILVCYGGKFEITQAIKKIVEKAAGSKRIRITEKTIEKNLFIHEDVDLIIRKGGKHRLSNFLVWQGAYSEIYVTDILWPDFSKNDLVKAIKWFNDVGRNFGR